MYCKFERYVEIHPFGKDYYKFLYDIKKETFKKQTLRLNMIVGSVSPCLCEHCKPDTSNEVNIKTY